MKLAVLVALTLSANVVAQPAAENAPAEAARKRRDALTTITVTFDMKEVREKGTIPRDNETGSPTTGQAATFPAKQVVMSSQENRLVVKGEKVRYESNQPVFSAITGEPLPERVIGTTDGTNARKLRTPPTGGDRTNRVGIVADRSHAVIYQFDFLYPLLLACDGTNPAICDVPFSQYTPTGTKLTVNGAVCEEYRQVRSAQEARTTTLWANAGDDYIPRRIRYSSGGKVTRQIDVVGFRKVGDDHTFPAEWTLTRYSPTGAVTLTHTVVVTDVEVNQSIGEDQFTIDFPPGLDVEDVVAKKYYLIRDDGSWMELREPGEDSAVIRAAARNPWWGRNWWLILSGVVAGGIILFGILRVWKRRRPAVLKSTA